MRKFSKTTKNRRITAKVACIGLLVVIAFLFVKLLWINHKDVQNPVFTDGKLKVVMIDVDNGDSILLLQNNQAMLIDTGYFTTYSKLRRTLKKYGVQCINNLVITHPHRDHAGGFTRLIYDYKIDRIYLSKYFDNIENSISELPFYKVFYFTKDLINAVSNNIVYAKDENGFHDFEFADSYVHFIGPINDEYENFNNYSLVFKVTYKENSILFTGDMHQDAEEELIDSGENLEADILKVGHHGSYTSTSESFLNAVNPEYAIVSCHNGKNNMYGHPRLSTVSLLKKYEILLYRTDELGTFEILLDRENIEFKTEPGDYKSGTKLYKEETTTANVS